MRLLKSTMITLTGALFLIVSVTATPSSAQTAVKAGDTVPFDGVLLTKEEVAKLIAEKEALQKKLVTEVEFERKKQETICELKVQSKDVSLKTQKEKYDAIVALKDKEIDRLYKQVEAESGDFGMLWFAGGATLGATAAVVIFFAAVQTQSIDVSQLVK